MSCLPEIKVVRHPRARRMRLSVDRSSGMVRLTLPPRAALAPALQWATSKADWIEQQRSSLPVPRPFEPGTVVTVDDMPLRIVHRPDDGRRVVRKEGKLFCSGDPEMINARICSWLRREALEMLSAETAEFAARLGVRITAVKVGDPRRRWGSCGANGVISYSWRLLLAPSWVRRATVAHEVAHRVHMDHSAAFHAVVAKLVGADAERSRDWLRTEGAALHWFGRGS